jgi:IS5 family transposase
MEARSGERSVLSMQNAKDARHDDGMARRKGHPVGLREVQRLNRRRQPERRRGRTGGSDAADPELMSEATTG